MCALPPFHPSLLPIVVSDAAAGGQVLMCPATFKAIKDMAGELGCVTGDGMQFDRMGLPWRR